MRQWIQTNTLRSKSLSRMGSHPGQNRRGQALIEMAFVLSMLILLTLGLIQYGFLYNAVGTLTHLTREGARFAAIHGTDNNTTVGGVTTTPDAAIRLYIRQRARGSSIRAADLPDAAITITPPDSNNIARSSGQPITVAIRYNMRNKLFLPSRFPGLNRISTYSTTITHVIE